MESRPNSTEPSKTTGSFVAPLTTYSGTTTEIGAAGISHVGVGVEVGNETVFVLVGSTIGGVGGGVAVDVGG